MTNFERIKAMSVEEMASLLCNCSDCGKCDFEPKDNKKKTIGCCLETMKNALDLITRLQARVEKAEKVEYFADKTIKTLQAENKDLAETIHNLTLEKDALFDRAAELKVKVERLKKNETDIDNFCRGLCKKRMFNGNAVAKFEDLQSYINKVKTEAVKEFAERFEKELSGFDMSSVGLPDYDRGYENCMTAIEDTIDNLVKEMVGENK